MAKYKAQTVKVEGGAAGDAAESNPAAPKAEQLDAQPRSPAQSGSPAQTPESKAEPDAAAASAPDAADGEFDMDVFAALAALADHAEQEV